MSDIEKRFRLRNEWKRQTFLKTEQKREIVLATSDSTDFFVVIHDRLLERGDVTEGDKKEHLEAFDGNRRKTNRKILSHHNIWMVLKAMGKV